MPTHPVCAEAPPDGWSEPGFERLVKATRKRLEGKGQVLCKWVRKVLARRLELGAPEELSEALVAHAFAQVSGAGR